MTRRHLAYECAGSVIVATLDTAPGRTGLLLVSGGNELRAGAWNGQAKFAARVAAKGYPVLRFDRRGVGDSEGVNGGFRSSAPDIAAAVAKLRAECPQINRVVAIGNCDAASALMLSGGAGIDALILSNPWTIEDDSEPPPAAVVRDHYRRRLADPAAIKRLVTGKVSVGKLARSIASTIRPARTAPDGLAAQMVQGISRFSGEIRFLVAGRDRTGLAFLANWDKADPRIRICPEASHSYVERDAQEWLIDQTLDVLSA